MEILILAFIAYGMSTILVYGSIFEDLRDRIHLWGKSPELPANRVGFFMSGLISCMLCTSTWVGFFLSFFIGSISQYYFDVNFLFGVFLDGMFTAGMVWSINSIVEFFEESRIK